MTSRNSQRDQAAADLAFERMEQRLASSERKILATQDMIREIDAAIQDWMDREQQRLRIEAVQRAPGAANALGELQHEWEYAQQILSMVHAERLEAEQALREARLNRGVAA